MENVILGLLLLQPRTIYQLRKRIDEGLNLMYSCSTGSIQAALRKLLRSGYILVNEVREQGKNKKLYCITDSGKAQFDSWVNSEIESSAAKNPELTKIYFMGFAEKQARKNIIEQRIDDLKKLRATLDEVCREGDEMSAQMPQNDILFFQLQTAKYGRDFAEFNIAWYNGLLEEMRRNAK